MGMVTYILRLGWHQIHKLMYFRRELLAGDLALVCRSCRLQLLAG